MTTAQPTDRLSKEQIDRLIVVLNRGVEDMGLEKMAALTGMPSEEIQRVRGYRLIVTKENVVSFCRRTQINPRYILDNQFPVYLPQ